MLVCVSLRLIRVASMGVSKWVCGVYFLEHGQLTGAYTTKENDSPTPETINW